jgi:putative peptidoglycan lipid II flippase
MTVATAVSRVTGFVRVVVVAGAMGATFLANTYQTANTAPNVVFELVAAGVLTSIFVPTFVDYLVKGREEEGWDAANALTSVALVGLLGLSLVLMLAAPLVMRALTLGVDDQALRAREIDLGTTFLQLFAPQIIFYGAGMIMTSALHAHRRFAMPAIAPIFNNIIVIAVYLTYALMRGDRSPELGSITTAEKIVLGAGTTLGVVAMTACLIPQLRRLGWRFRFRFEPAHPAVRKAIHVGAWALGYAGGYQAGLIVVLMLGNRVEGGVAAYQWAYTFFYLPHALFGVPVFNALFPAMSEHVAAGDVGGVVTRMREGLAMLGFILLPVAALMAVAAEPAARLTLEYGAMTGTSAELVGMVLVGFAVGLPAYSMFLIYTRAFYAIGDARTPTLVNAAAVSVSSLVGAALFFGMSGAWRVPGLSIGHSVGFAAGALVIARLFGRRAGARRATAFRASLLRSLTVATCALGAMLVVRALLPEDTKLGAAVNLLAVATVGSAVYLGAMRTLGSPELTRLGELVGRLGRRGRRAPGGT